MKNKRERQLHTPTNHLERQAIKQFNFESILHRFGVHFGNQNGSKIASNFKSKIDSPKNRQGDGGRGGREGGREEGYFRDPGPCGREYKG